jgi:amino acid transporter
MKKKLLSLVIPFAMVALLVLPLLASAGNDGGLDLGTSEVAEHIGLGTQDIRVTIASIIRYAMGLLGIVAVVIILVGGFKYMTAMGNDEEIKKAKKLIFSGIIGLVLILTSFAIASWVLSTLQTATTE